MGIFKKTTLTALEKIGKLMKDFHVRPIQQIVYSFDPFVPNVLSCRQVLYQLNAKKVLATSSARSKIDVRSDRSKPQIDILFVDGHRVIFKTENLTALDILQRLDKMCKAKDTYKPETDTALTKVSGKPKGKRK